MQLHYITLWVAGVWHCGRNFSFGVGQFCFCIWLYCSVCVTEGCCLSISSFSFLILENGDNGKCLTELWDWKSWCLQSSPFSIQDAFGHSPTEPGKSSWNTKPFIQLNLFSLENLGYRKHFVFLSTLFSLGNSASVQIKFSWSLATVWAHAWGSQKELQGMVRNLGSWRGHPLQERQMPPGHASYSHVGCIVARFCVKSLVFKILIDHSCIKKMLWEILMHEREKCNLYSHLVALPLVQTYS